MRTESISYEKEMDIIKKRESRKERSKFEDIMYLSYLYINREENEN